MSLVLSIYAQQSLGSFFLVLYLLNIAKPFPTFSGVPQTTERLGCILLCYKHINLYFSALKGNQESFLKTLAKQLHEEYKNQTFEQIVLSVKRYLTRTVKVS